MRNGIALLKKHIENLKEKIKKQNDNSRQFLDNVSVLVDQSFRSNQSQHR